MYNGPDSYYPVLPAPVPVRIQYGYRQKDRTISATIQLTTGVMPPTLEPPAHNIRPVTVVGIVIPVLPMTDIPLQAGTVAVS